MCTSEVPLKKYMEGSYWEIKRYVCVFERNATRFVWNWVRNVTNLEQEASESSDDGGESCEDDLDNLVDHYEITNNLIDALYFSF